MARAHVERSTFQSGVDRGRWRLVSITWPFVVIAVSAAERSGAPQEYALRFECSNYPSVASTARFWDVEHDCSLSHGQRPWGTGRVALAFRASTGKGINASTCHATARRSMGMMRGGPSTRG
jgi:hypothetical protein